MLEAGFLGDGEENRVSASFTSPLHPCHRAIVLRHDTRARRGRRGRRSTSHEGGGAGARGGEGATRGGRATRRGEDEKGARRDLQASWEERRDGVRGEKRLGKWLGKGSSGSEKRRSSRASGRRTRSDRRASASTRPSHWRFFHLLKQVSGGTGEVFYDIKK